MTNDWPPQLGLTRARRGASKASSGGHVEVSLAKCDEARYGEDGIRSGDFVVLACSKIGSRERTNAREIRSRAHRRRREPPPHRPTMLGRRLLPQDATHRPPRGQKPFPL
jgi:hypothetical protein